MVSAWAIFAPGFNVKGLTTATNVIHSHHRTGGRVRLLLVGAFTTVLVLVVLTLVSLFEKKFIRRNVIRIIKVDAVDNPHIFRTVRGNQPERRANRFVQDPEEPEERPCARGVYSAVERNEKIED